MNSVDTYNQLSSSNLSFPSSFVFPTTKKTTPTELDYRKGFIKRSFCLYISSEKIVEIPPLKKSRYTNNYFVTIKTVKWKISGSQRNVYKDNILFDKGVYETNLETLQRLKSSGFKNIESFLSPLDLYKN